MDSDQRQNTDGAGRRAAFPFHPLHSGYVADAEDLFAATELQGIAPGFEIDRLAREVADLATRYGVALHEVRIYRLAALSGFGSLDAAIGIDDLEGSTDRIIPAHLDWLRAQCIEDAGSALAMTRRLLRNDAVLAHIEWLLETMREFSLGEAIAALAVNELVLGEDLTEEQRDGIVQFRHSLLRLILTLDPSLADG